MISKSHAHANSGEMGSLCFSTTARKLKIAVPSTYSDFVSSRPNNEEIRRYLLTLSESDQVMLLKALIVNYHEVTHYHQLLSSIAGLQIIETSGYVDHLGWQMLNHRENATLPLNRHHYQGELLDELKRAVAELDYCAEGLICRKCYPNILPPPDQLKVGRLQKSPEISVLASSWPGVSFVFYGDKNAPLKLALGSLSLFEALSCSMEIAYGFTIFQQLDIAKPAWYPFKYGDEYHFLGKTLDNLSDGRLGPSEFQKLHRNVGWLALNPGSDAADRKSGIQHSGVKTVHLLDQLSSFDWTARQAPELDYLERQIHERYGYATLSTNVRHLKSNARIRLSFLEERGTTAGGEMMRDFYSSQLLALDGGISECIANGEHLFRWTEFPKPPFSVVKIIEPVPKRIIVMNDPTRGFWTFLNFFTHSLLSQALTERSIRCPIKLEGIACPRKDQTCGYITELAGFTPSRCCTFELLMDEFVNGNETSLSEHLEFTADLLAA